MKEQFSNEEDLQSDSNITSQLLIYTEEDGNTYFSCDWVDSEEAKMAEGTILYRLADGELVDEIIDSIKSRCVLEDREEDHEKIFNFYNSLRVLKRSEDKGRKEEVVINPLDATTFN